MVLGGPETDSGGTSTKAVGGSSIPTIPDSEYPVDSGPDDPRQDIVTTEQLRLERLRLNDALRARDAVVMHLADACASIQQKTAIIQRLEREKADLQTQLSFMNGRQAVGAYSGRPERSVWARESANIQVEVGNLADIFRRLESENLRLSTQNGGCSTDSPQSATGIRGRASDWQKSLHKILRIVMKPTVDESAVAGGQRGVLAISTSPATLPSDQKCNPDDPANDFAEDAIPRPAPLHTPPAERSRARNAMLLALPVPPGIPSDVLKPIVIPQQFTFQDFLTTLPVAVRQQMGSYRVLRMESTVWCSECEEHGYYIAPMFKSVTSQRSTAAHGWIAADLAPQLNTTTECFYHKDGVWYYTGFYRTFWLDELSPAEWENLPAETTGAIVKQTLAERKGVTAQHKHETAQLYAVGALKVACIGLQCVSFNHNVYVALVEQVEKCIQTGRWRNNVPGTGPSSAWTGTIRSPTLSPHMLTLSPHSTTSPVVGDQVKSPVLPGYNDQINK